MQKRFKRLFQPESIAIVGGSARADSLGYGVVSNLVAGFKGKLVVINPKYQEVQGLPCFSRLDQAPHPIDWAVVCTPGHTLAEVVADCGKRGVRGVVLLTGGDEDDPAAKKRLYDRLRALRKQYGLRLIGPNSHGVVQPHTGLVATLGDTTALPAGNLALITQSGALGAAVLEWAAKYKVGFSHFFSLGAMLDISHADLIDFLGADGRTAAILIYMENMQSARRFMSAARAFARSKPIIVLKSGRSQEEVVSDQEIDTLATPDRIYDAAFRRAGIIRVDLVSQLFNCAQALALQPRPTGNRLAVVTNAAGPGLLATDYLLDAGGATSRPPDDALALLRQQGTLVRAAGPAVVLARGASPACFRAAIQAALQQDTCDGLVVVYAPYPHSDPAGIAEALGECAKATRKPILASWMGEVSVAPALPILKRHKIPQYRFPESAVDTFMRMYHYHRNLQLLQETPPSLPVDLNFQTATVRALLDQVRASGRHRLTEGETRQALQAYGIHTNPFVVVRNTDEAIRFAETQGFPVVMKIASPDIVNKTDLGAIQLNLRTPADITRAFEEIIGNVRRQRPQANIQGVMVEKMVNKRFELLLSAKRDPAFGPVIVFGRGGRIATLKPDIQLGLPPLNLALARRLLERTRIFSLLQGYRELEGVDLLQLEMALVRLAYLLVDFPDINQVDINPYVMDAQGGVVLDAIIGIDPQPPTAGQPYQHLVISPYPEHYRRTVTARNGQMVQLRPIRPEDEPLEAEMLKKQSRETNYFRFFGQAPRIDHQFLSRFTQIDYDREMAIIGVVTHPDGREEMVGVVRLIADPWREGGEYAILISDAYQGQGLGLLMTEYILEIARHMGLQLVHATVLATNQAMIGLFRKLGFSLEREDFETYRVEKVM